MWDKFQGTTLQYRIDNETDLPEGTLPIMRSMNDIGVNLTNFEFNNEAWVPLSTLRTIESLRTQIFFGSILVNATYTPMSSMHGINVKQTNFNYNDEAWVPPSTLERIGTVRAQVFYGTIPVFATFLS